VVVRGEKEVKGDGGEGGEGGKGIDEAIWGGTLVMFIAMYLVGVRKRRKARPRWEKTEQEGDVVDDDGDDDVVDDGSDAVGRERGKKHSKGKEQRRNKTKKTPNNSAA
jgi:hypothetical protein